MKTTTDSKYTVISLFSGCGGLDAGLHRTGRFKTLACLEYDKHACASLEANKAQGRLDKDCQVIQADIATLPPEVVMERLGMKPGQLDVICGGPPCQSWSISGKREGTNVLNGQLLFGYLDWVSVLKPKYFIMENVTGLLSAKQPDGTKPFDIWKKKARKLDYTLTQKIVNALDYGVAQNRKRIVVIGSRDGKEIELADSYRGLGHKTLRDAIGDLVEERPVYMRYGIKTQAIYSLVPAGGTWVDLPEDHPERVKCAKRGATSSTWRRLSWDKPSPTICASQSSSQGACHPDEYRHLSVREIARVQGFPDDWVFCGPMDAQYRQIGNAVAVPMAESIGMDVARELDAETANTTVTTSVECE